MKTLSRYLAREVATSTLLVLAALLMLWVFYDLLAELGSLRALNAAQFLVLLAATIPGHLYELLPVAALIGTLFALAQLASNSEYGVMRTSGVSVLQVAMVLFGVSLVVAGAVLHLDIVWLFSDITNGLMVYPNLIGLMALSHLVVEEAKRFEVSLAASAEGCV